MPRVILLDTKTGKRASVAPPFDQYDGQWWAEGNGSCDCNRRLVFRPQPVRSGRCLGAKRYLVVEADLEGFTLEELNAAYPAQLREAFLPGRQQK